MVVDAVIQNWLTVVDGEEAVPEVFGRALQWIMEIFYEGDGLLATAHPACF